MCENNSYILVIGASIVDIIGLSKNKYRQNDSIPGKIKISFGGVCRNIAENLARMEVNTEFVSVLGNDEQGKNILEHSKIIGYNMEHSLILDEACTPTYMAILNEEGEMESAVVDMECLQKLKSSFIDSKSEVIKNAEYVILDADNPEIMEYLLKKFSKDTKFILDPVSAAKAEKIKDMVKYFHTIKPNRHETEILCGFEIKNDSDLLKAGEYFINLGVKNVFISLDQDGIFYMNENTSGKIGTKNVVVKNVTGAGDSFVAGIGYGYLKEMPLEDTVRHAIAMSIITIAHEETIHPGMSKELVEEYIKTIEWV